MFTYRKRKFRKTKNKKSKTKKSKIKKNKTKNYQIKRQSKKNKYGGTKRGGNAAKVAADLAENYLPKLRYILKNNLLSLENDDTYKLLKDIKNTGISDKKLLDWAENQELNIKNMEDLLNEYHNKQLIDVLKNDLPENIKWSTEQHRPTFSKESNSYDPSKKNWSIINRGIPELANVTNDKALKLIHEMKKNKMTDDEFINLAKKKGLEHEMDHLLKVYELEYGV